jgi:hypothetical protein
VHTINGFSHSGVGQTHNRRAWRLAFGDGNFGAARLRFHAVEYKGLN